MLKLTKYFFKLSENIEIFISLIFINVFLLYFNSVTNEQTLILITTTIFLIILFSSTITNMLEMLLKTDDGLILEQQCRDINKISFPYITNFILLVLIVSLLMLSSVFMSNVPIAIFLLIFVIEIILNLSIFNLQNNILKFLIKAVVFAFFIPLMISFYQIQNLVTMGLSTITFDYKMIFNIFIISLPLLFLFINISLRPLINNSSNDIIKSKQAIIFEISYFILVFSIIPAIIYNILPLFFVLLLIIGYFISDIMTKKYHDTYFEWQCITYIVGILIFTI